MGIHLPAKDRPKTTIKGALQAAEEDHYLACPTADFLTRAAALTLDVVFFFLISSGVNRLWVFLLMSLIPDTGVLAVNVAALYQALLIATESVLVYFYLLWPVYRFGGTPGKLLLRLRIVDVDSGEKLSLQRTVFRELVGKGIGVISLGFGFFLALLRQDGRTLHDLLAGSVVKKIFGPS